MFDYTQAAEIIKESRFPYDGIGVDAIANVIQKYLEELIEEALNDPEEFFKNNYRFWHDLDKAALAIEKQQEIATADETSAA
jgi:hypothetical protein